MESSTAGFIGQLKGRLTNRRYKYATIYVDNYSSLGYLYLQKDATADETLKGKQAFELFSQQHGVKIIKYHADNGIFRANKWVNDCSSKNQALTFAAVNAHHQNGRAERRIRLLQELTRAQLIFASSKWKQTDLTALWPYAMRAANSSLNNTPHMQKKNGKTPMQLFSSSDIHFNPKHMINI